MRSLRSCAAFAVLVSILAGGCTLDLNSLHSPTALLDASRLRGSAPLAVTFDASRSHADGAVADYAWSFEGDPSDLHGPNCTYIFRVPGAYSVVLVVTDGDGRTGKAQVEVVVDPSGGPVASFSLSGDAPRVDQWVTFDGSGSYDPAGLPLSFAWDFGDGAAAVGAAAGHAYSAPGLYIITLVVRDASGSESSVRRNLLVQETTPGGCGGGRPIALRR